MVEGHSHKVLASSSSLLIRTVLVAQLVRAIDCGSICWGVQVPSNTPIYSLSSVG